MIFAVLWLCVGSAAANPESTCLVCEQISALDDSRAVASLWLLARDADASVRESALDAAQQRCDRVDAKVCVALLSLFSKDPSEDIAWRARDELLCQAAERAFLGASVDYKRDVLSRLIGQLDRDPKAQIPLRALLRDDNEEIRAFAEAVFDRATP